MIRARIGQAVHGLRTALKGWSRSKDRDYHDSVFSEQNFDPFTFSYTGYVSTCRIADLAAPYLEKASAALDLGCGTGEITCELARRFPNVSFQGVDQSENGIRNARGHAQKLGLTNVSFDVADVESFVPAAPVDIVFLLDAFHHLSDPGRFVARWKQHTKLFALIEPRGDWKGSWRKDLNFDWIVPELEKIRHRIAYTTRDEEPFSRPLSNSSPSVHGDPIEHRYNLADFEMFFQGMALDIRGTISALEIYPPDPYRQSSSRERFGRLTYELIKEIDDALYKKDIDLLAKHWFIVADQHGSTRKVRLPKPDAGTNDDPFVQGPYDVEYFAYDGPESGQPGANLHAVIRLRNKSWRSWSSSETENPVYLSYHWFETGGVMIKEEGLRNRLPREIAPGEECACELEIRTPNRPGRYVLALDLVHEGVTWFSQFGSPPHRIKFLIK